MDLFCFKASGSVEAVHVRTASEAVDCFACVVGLHCLFLFRTSFYPGAYRKVHKDFIAIEPKIVIGISIEHPVVPYFVFDFFTIKRQEESRYSPNPSPNVFRYVGLYP